MQAFAATNAQYKLYVFGGRGLSMNGIYIWNSLFILCPYVGAGTNPALASVA